MFWKGKTLEKSRPNWWSEISNLTFLPSNSHASIVITLFDPAMILTGKCDAEESKTSDRDYEGQHTICTVPVEKEIPYRRNVGSHWFQ